MTLRILVGAVCVASLAQADAPLVYCEGTACGGGGERAYTYPIDSASYPMMEFEVGTDDPNPRSYTNVLTPKGWSFKVLEEGMGHDHGGFTLHGRVSPGPCRCLTQGRVRWWTDDPQYAAESFTFGFDHKWRPEDVGWNLLTRREGPPPKFFRFREFWDAQVGTGAGPLHGPSAPSSGDLAIRKAKCKVRKGAVKKATVMVKNAGPNAEHRCTLHTGQELIKRSKNNGKLRFKFKGGNAPPCGSNGATVRERYKSFDCDC